MLALAVGSFVRLRRAPSDVTRHEKTQSVESSQLTKTLATPFEEYQSFLHISFDGLSRAQADNPHRHHPSACPLRAVAVSGAARRRQELRPHNKQLCRINRHWWPKRI